LIRVAIEASAPALDAGLRALISSFEEIGIVSEINQADLIIRSAPSASFLEEEMEAPSTASILFLSDIPLTLRGLRRLPHSWGIVPLDASAEELRAAIHALSQGLMVGDPSLLFRSEEETIAASPLTDRETEVLTLLSQGLANKQIASTLGISEHTVKFHVSSIYTKLNVTNRTEAVRAGLRGGWIAL